MSAINLDKIMEKVSEYVNSDAGKRVVRDRIDYIISNSSGRTDAGDYMITLANMDDMAYEMRDILQRNPSVVALPDSVRDHFDSLVHSLPSKITKDMYIIEISFQDDLSRKSLFSLRGKRAGTRTGPGIKNIVSLFDTGYSASRIVVGAWDGHTIGDTQIESLPYREELGFMKESVDEFNSRIGRLYDGKVQAFITADPEFYVGNHMRDLV